MRRTSRSASLDVDSGSDEPRAGLERRHVDLRLETLAVSVGSGVLAVIGGPAPTGQVIADAVLVGGAVAAVTWFGSVVPPRVAGVMALLAGAATFTWLGLVLGVVAFLAASVWTGTTHRMSPLLAPALIGLGLNLAARSELDVVLGASTIVAIVLTSLLLTIAYPRRAPRTRRWALGGVIVGVVVAGVATAILASSLADAADDLREGERIVTDSLDLLGDGEIREAQASFERAGELFDRAHRRLSGAVNHPAAVVPVVAQHRRAAIELSAQAARSSTTLATQLALIDLDELSFQDGRIDTQAIADLIEPLTLIQNDIAALGDTVDDVDDPWLVEPLRERLVELGDDIDAQLERSDEFVRVIRQVPPMLGAERKRVYFIAFTTPAEARGLGGFMGNWAELTISNGAVELTALGRSDDLDEAAAPGERTVTGPADWLARYGRYGFDNGPGNGVGGDPWKNITMSPSVASTGEVMAELYPQSGGRAVDGVFVLDVFAVSALLQFTGPIELPDGDGVVTSESAPRFLLNDQYEQTDTDQRVDVLEIVSREAFDRLLNTDLPPAQELLDVLGPLVEEGRLVGYASAPREQEMLEEVGLAGTLVDPEGRDGLAITFNNAIGNKIDFFLRAAANYTVDVDRAAGTAQAKLAVELENQAPRFDEPNYVIGNAIGEPDGSNRTLVSVYSRLPVVSATVDGVDVDLEVTTEAGYFVAGVFVDLSSRQTGTLVLEMAGPLDVTDGYELLVRSPPSARPLTLEIEAHLRNDDTVQSDQWTVRRAGRYTFALTAP